MGIDAWIAAATTLALLAGLIASRVAPDLLFGAALAVLLLTGVIDSGQAFAGFSNPGVITVALLYVVVQGLRDTGGVHWITQRLLGRPRGLVDAQLRLMTPVTFLSAFLNNTPVVAMLIPAVADWARKFELAPSKLLLPLSYAAILGGTCTLVGTSTNLVIHGLLLGRGDRGLGMFELAWIGVPTAVLGFGLIVATGRWLLPDRRPARASFADPREYTTEMTVQPDGPLVGRTIEAAGLRNLGSAYLVELERDNTLLPAVSPDTELRGGDRLVFAGVVSAMVELRRMPGLVPATDQIFKLDGARSRRTLVEAVVSDHCPLVGNSVRGGRFRTTYGAVVIAVARGGERIDRKIGDIVLRAGDTLLLETRSDFARRMRDARDFYLVSQLEDSHPLRFERAALAGAILLAMVGSVALGWLGMLEAALAAAGLMLITRCLDGGAARRSVDWQVLIVIAAAFGIGEAIETTGLAQAIADGLTALAGDGPRVNLLVVYAATALFSAVVTNNAAAVLMFPVVGGIAADLGVDPRPLVIALVMGASASFATPIGYQTNLMVYGPGGYRFTDYLRLGVPLTAVGALVTLLVVPWIWPF